MRIPIDAVGRVVIPKSLRVELGITGPTELDATSRDGVIELSIADVPARVETRDGTPVIVCDEPVQSMSVDDVRAAIDRARR